MAWVLCGVGKRPHNHCCARGPVVRACPRAVDGKEAAAGSVRAPWGRGCLAPQLMFVPVILIEGGSAVLPGLFCSDYFGLLLHS